MITTADTLSGFDVTQVIGPVESVIEREFTSVSIRGVGVIQGGGLSELLFDVKQALARAAAEIGADGVIGFRYATIGRDLEKSLIAYRTAVKCQKSEAKS